MRRQIAEHKLRSRRTAAHCTTVVEADFSRVAARRRELREAMRARGVNLTYLAFVALATVEALGEHSKLNASVEDDQILFHEDVNLGIAVALEDGLVVPVIHGADRLELREVVERRIDVVARAREGKLRLDDVQGGTFTISNLGMFGVDSFGAIVNPPQAAILAVGRITDRVVAVGGVPEVRPTFVLTLSLDHRAIDGAIGARFLDTLVSLVEEPAGLVV
jgi:pyruvate/2-oxoglutarate dehydrogenase complex dihydrolipoamide acyltransferase (E2) component